MAMKERLAISSSGWLALLIGLGLAATAVAPFAGAARHPTEPAMYVAEGIGLIVAALILLTGNFVIGPNEARVLTFFGRYTGTVRESGLRWANPFSAKRSVSLRARNFETQKIKVNDIDGNPIEI